MGILGSRCLILTLGIIIFAPSIISDSSAQDLINRDAVERPKRDPQSLRERQFKVYQEALELMNAEPAQYDEALVLLLDVDYTIRNSTRNPNAYERAVFFNTIANIYRAQEKHEKALDYFLMVLEQDVELPYELEDGVNFIIGQLNFILEDYETALTYLNNWLRPQIAPSTNNVIFIANVYYSAGLKEGLSADIQADYFRTAISLVHYSIELEISKGNSGKENWYVFLRVLHDSLGESDKVLEISELLVSRWPKKLYFIELSGIYANESLREGLPETEIANFEKKQMVTLELAHRQEMLTEARELESMSQLFLYHDVPYKSSKTLNFALENDISTETLKNLDLLAYGYLEGKDYDKAISPLSKAAVLTEDGERYMRLANLYLQIDNYVEAAVAIEKALEKGGFDRPDLARIIQGQAYVVLARFDEARAVFREASKDERSVDIAANWLRYIDNEEKRLKDIAEYLN